MGNIVRLLTHGDHLIRDGSNCGVQAHREADGSKTRDQIKTGKRGYWQVDVITSGNYSISLRRWPSEAGQPIPSGLPAGENVPETTRAFRARPGKAIPIHSAVLIVDEEEIESKPVEPGDGEMGAYYVTVAHRPPVGS